MTHVRLVGPDGDGRNLVVATPEGEQFSLPVTEELRALVTHAIGADGTPIPTLPPREVQRRLRAGFTSEDLSRLSGVPVENIRRYEEPILAERAYIAELARATRVGRDPSAPILGELVMDRLASKGVRGASISWDAWRVIGSPWRVAVAWDAGSGQVRAEWTFDHLARTVVADDADARWLTETDLLDVPSRPRHLSPVRYSDVAPATPFVAAAPAAFVAAAPAASAAPVAPVAPIAPIAPVAPAAPAASVSPGAASATPVAPVSPGVASPDSRDDAPFDRQAEASRAAAGPRTELLAELQAKRGVREPMVVEEVDEEEFEGFGPLNMREAEVGFASGGSTRRGGSTTRDGASGSVDRSDAQRRGAPRRHRPGGRASMPRWDEIVFGTTTDEA